MTTRLDAVNQCLAMMGEAPLNTLAEEHTFRDSALHVLDRNDKAIQNKGWWYNTERLTLSVNPADLRVYLPGDATTIRPSAREYAYDHRRYVQRGRVLYDLYTGSEFFDAGFTLKVELVRRLPLEIVPESVAQFIVRKTVLDFQQEYDGDQTRTRNLSAEVMGGGGFLGLYGEAKAEHIRNVGHNFLDNSPGVSILRRTYTPRRGGY